MLKEQQPKKLQEQSTLNNTPCLKRWWRQVCFMPFLHRNWQNKSLTDALSTKVTEAEQGHRGEVVFIIENSLPMHTAYRQNCRERAIELFSDYRVWDTEENTGVLVYLNVCEHDLEIVADRGISSHVSSKQWQDMCNKAISGLAEAKILSSLSILLTDVGDVLRTHYQLEDDPNSNELSNKVIDLR